VFVDDGVTAGEPLDATLFLTWSVEHEGAAIELDCFEAAADTVRVSARNLDTGDVAVDLFDCDDAKGRTAPLEAGDYRVNVDLVDCGGGATCESAIPVSRAKAVATLPVWDDGDYDLGHFVFLVN